VTGCVGFGAGGGVCGLPASFFGSGFLCSSSPSASSSGGVTFPNYGRAKGAPVAGASMQDLEFYANGARRSLADPAKQRFHASEQKLLDAIEAEIARQNPDPDPNNGYETAGDPPPHSDGDAPF